MKNMKLHRIDRTLSNQNPRGKPHDVPNAIVQAFIYQFYQLPISPKGNSYGRLIPRLDEKSAKAFSKGYMIGDFYFVFRLRSFGQLQGFVDFVVGFVDDVVVDVGAAGEFF